MHRHISSAARVCTLTAFTLGLFAGRILAQDAPPKAEPTPVPAAAANPRIEMVIAMPDKKTGTILIELLPKDAPKTVAHFLALVNKKFYDGILFHRVVPDFVAQAGDPASKSVDGAKLRELTDEEVGQQYHLGIGGSGEAVDLEEGPKHDRGTLGLARSADPNSGDSQFFFNLKNNDALNTLHYCVFGKIVKGLDVMDKIGRGDKIVSIHLVKTVPPKKEEPKKEKPKE